MSNSSVKISARRNNVQTAIASFIGMAVAIPVSLMIFSATQPAKALQDDSYNNDKGYALYAQAFTQGFLANSENSNGKDNGSAVTCEEPEDQSKHDGSSEDQNGGPSVTSDKVSAKHVELAKHINNSFQEFTTTNITNHDSNNSVQSVVSVSHSNGAVVSTGTSTSGGVSNDVNVENEDSNNTKNEDSFNTVDSNNETSVVVEDSFNHETEITDNTDNSTTINDSFNKDVEVDVTIKDSGNTTPAKPHNNYSS